MKKSYLFVLLLITGSMAAQSINFPDNNFRVALLSWAYGYSEEEDEYFPIDVNEDGQIQFDEALELESLDLSYDNLNITDITGIEYFTNLKTFKIKNQDIPIVNMVGPLGLESFDCSYNQISSLNVSNLPNLKILGCNNNELTDIDLSNNLALETLACHYNNLTELDINFLQNLTNVLCNYNYITDLDVSGLINLRSLTCSKNYMTSLTLTGLISLEILMCPYNELTIIDLTGLSSLTMAVINDNLFTTLDLSFENNIAHMDIENNMLTSIDLAGCTKLIDLDVRNNQLSSLDFSNCSVFENLFALNNSLEYINLKNGFPGVYVNADNNPNLSFVCVDENENPDIITYLNQTFPNCVVSTTCSLGNNSYDLVQNVSLYPNPASNILNIEFTDDVNFKVLEIYNIMGQRILEIQNSANSDSIDISMLVEGTYVLKIITDRGVAYTKFIKK